MSRLRDRALPLAVLVGSMALLIGSIAWVAAGPGGPDWVSGDSAWTAGPVADLDEAQQAAEEYAEPQGFGVGEVMEFENGYYAILVDADGANATEIIIDPETGAVRPEWGPAMMWNTRYGGMGWYGSPSITQDEARDLAENWLQAHRPGEQAGEVEAFPGYYTLHTETTDGRIAGMLSVNAGSGEIWYHTWHGDFIDSTEHD